MDPSQLTYSVSGRIAHVTLNNPDRFNAIGPVMATELVQALQAAGADDEVRVILLSGAGRAFCAGGDLAELAAGLGRGDPGMAGFVDTLGRIAMLIRTTAKPVVASVHRSAAGAGLGLALLSDFCVASEDTRFMTAFAKVGLACDTGVGFVLARTLGHVRATELFATGRELTAIDAHRLGLITAVVPGDDLSQATVDLIGVLLTGSQAAFAAFKQQIWQAQFAGFEQHLAQEVALQRACAAGPDFAEGLAAFGERRPPEFG
ncbi:MAG: enoyl-CoA hydratase/isomerase family protein [Brooklawnia sp.]|uniref:enoyl-CoA hydratase/isomerase family protein n=1 Tax=Brooklawnia sp. TaxID=2699740 RepID=UPI003C7804A2